MSGINFNAKYYNVPKDPNEYKLNSKSPDQEELQQEKCKVETCQLGSILNSDIYDLDMEINSHTRGPVAHPPKTQYSNCGTCTDCDCDTHGCFPDFV